MRGRIRQRVEVIMVSRITKHFVSSALLCAAFLCNAASAQRPAPNPGSTTRQGEAAAPFEGGIDVYLKGADGGPIEGIAMVTLVAPTGQVLGQGTTLGGNIQFNGLASSEYTIQVVAPGYQDVAQQFRGHNSGTLPIIIYLQPVSNVRTGAGSSQ